MKKTYIQYLEKMAKNPRLKPLGDFFSGILPDAFDAASNGNLPKWLEAYQKLPDLTPSAINIDTDKLIAKGEIDDETRKTLADTLHMLHPWRKGPFELFGVHINTEWRSDWKWTRLESHISPLKGRNILDIGCGNGYHCFRMAASGAESVTGIDTSLLSIMQFKALQKYFRIDNVEIFPVGIQNMPDYSSLFDTVFSMGVIYHRKDPSEHLRKIKTLLKPGGECIIETLIIDGDENDYLVPEERYAMMRNVHKIPSVPMLEKWLSESGFTDIRTVNVTVTSTEEQRSTEWMKFHSLSNFLDPEDQTRTVEDYPAPKRAIVIAK